jgi:hypothetical protein
MKVTVEEERDVNEATNHTIHTNPPVGQISQGTRRDLTNDHNQHILMLKND